MPTGVPEKGKQNQNNKVREKKYFRNPQKAIRYSLHQLPLVLLPMNISIQLYSVHLAKNPNPSFFFFLSAELVRTSP